MKTLHSAILSAIICAICAQPSLAQDDGAIEIRATPEGGQAAVDLAALAGLPRVSAAPWYRKPDVAAWEGLKATGRGIAAHPIATTVGVLGSVAGVRASQGKLDDDLKNLAAAVGLRDEPGRKDLEPTPQPIEGWSAVVENNAGNTEIVYHGASQDTAQAVVRNNIGDTRIIFGDEPVSSEE